MNDINSSQYTMSGINSSQYTMSGVISSLLTMASTCGFRQARNPILLQWWKNEVFNIPACAVMIYIITLTIMASVCSCERIKGD